MDQSATPVVSTQPLRVEATTAAPWVTVSRTREADQPQTPVSPRRVLTQVVAGLAIVLLLVGVLGSLAAQRLAEREAVNDAATIADVLADAVITPALTDALTEGDAAAVAAMDTVVRERVLGPRIVRVKLWSPDGQVLYADEPQLVGRTFALSADQRAAISQPQTKAEVSDLESSENEFETGGRLLEVYRPVWTPSGRELLFETYSPYTSVSERSGQLWRGFAGVTVSSLLMLVVLTAPILWRLLRRLGEAQRQRERLLERTVEASDAERRRIAGTLHDGPVQDLVASAFVAAGSAAKAEASGQPRMADDLRGLASSVRGNIRTLRSLLVDIYPPSLSTAGLAHALTDLAQSGDLPRAGGPRGRRGGGRPRSLPGPGAARLPRRPGVPAQQHQPRRSVHSDAPAGPRGGRGRPRCPRRRTGVRHRRPRAAGGGSLRAPRAGRPGQRRRSRAAGGVTARRGRALAPDDATGRSRMIRVVVVDDHAMVRTGLVALLEASDDITVVGQAPDGDAARQVAVDLRPDVVLMDLSMPRMDGAEPPARCSPPSLRSRWWCSPRSPTADGSARLSTREPSATSSRTANPRTSSPPSGRPQPVTRHSTHAWPGCCCPHRVGRRPTG